MIELNYQPKGGMCFGCVNKRNDCSVLAFDRMPLIQTLEDGTHVVRCTNYTRTPNTNADKPTNTPTPHLKKRSECTCQCHSENSYSMVVHTIPCCVPDKPNDELVEIISEAIESKLGYTNGWSIPADDYTKESKEVAYQIISLVKERCKDAVEDKKDDGGHIYADGINSGLDRALKAIDDA